MVSDPERSVRVSTLEPFFDLVFVFTITQLTGGLVDGAAAASGRPVGGDRLDRARRRGCSAQRCSNRELTASDRVAIVRDLMRLARS
jgi:hypothetical protein